MINFNEKINGLLHFCTKELMFVVQPMSKNCFENLNLKCAAMFYSNKNNSTQTNYYPPIITDFKLNLTIPILVSNQNILS